MSDYIVLLSCICYIYAVIICTDTAGSAKTRMDLVRVVAVQVLAGLKDTADNAYKVMNDWLGARFLKEMER